MHSEAAQQLHLRAMAEADLERVLVWRNHPDVRSFMYTQDEISLASHRRWFHSAATDPRKHVLIFEIDSCPFGFVNFTESGNGRVADWGFYTSPDAPKGTGKKLGNTAIVYAFNQLDLHKICGQALAYNERSIGMHRSLGFAEEGVLRDQHFDGQRFHDVHQFGLLRVQSDSGSLT